jgi:hypothetical protein
MGLHKVPHNLATSRAFLRQNCCHISMHCLERPMSAVDVNFFFTMREQLKLYHWQTELFSRHKATDGLLEALDELIDKYVEVYMGKYGRPKLTTKTNTVRIQNMNESMAQRFVKTCITYLEGPLVKHLKPTDTDLVNIRDEMLAELNQLLYLFTLH